MRCHRRVACPPGEGAGAVTVLAAVMTPVVLVFGGLLFLYWRVRCRPSRAAAAAAAAARSARTQNSTDAPTRLIRRIARRRPARGSAKRSAP